MALAGKRSGKSYRVYIVMGDGEEYKSIMHDFDEREEAHSAMNKIPNRQAICDTLMKSAAHDPDITELYLSTIDS